MKPSARSGLRIRKVREAVHGRKLLLPATGGYRMVGGVVRESQHAALKTQAVPGQRLEMAWPFSRRLYTNQRGVQLGIIMGTDGHLHHELVGALRHAASCVVSACVPTVSGGVGSAETSGTD